MQKPFYHDKGETEITENGNTCGCILVCLTD